MGVYNQMAKKSQPHLQKSCWEVKVCMIDICKKKMRRQTNRFEQNQNSRLLVVNSQMNFWCHPHLCEKYERNVTSMHFNFFKLTKKQAILNHMKAHCKAGAQTPKWHSLPPLRCPSRSVQPSQQLPPSQWILHLDYF